MAPTIVLVHGAFAESSSWDRVIDALLNAGHRVIAAPNPLRSVEADAESVSDLVRSLTGPVLLVGHSYGCVVTTNIAADAGDLVGLVYIAGFAPDSGESVQSIVERFPGSTLGQTLRTVPRRDGTTDATIDPEHFHAQFAADVPATEAARMAVTQRPITLEALAGATGPDPLWKRVPSWFLLAGEDRNVPPDAIRFMAERAGARRLVEIAGASHAIAVSQPGPTAELILEAAQSPAVA